MASPIPAAYLYIQTTDAWGKLSGQWEHVGTYHGANPAMASLLGMAVDPRMRERQAEAALEAMGKQGRKGFWLLGKVPDGQSIVGCFGHGMAQHPPHMFTWTSSGYVQGVR